MAEKAAILNLIKSIFFKMHPHLKSHGHFEFYRVEFFQDAYSPEITHFVL